MKFLVDAQLPARLARFLHDAGHDTRRLLVVATGNITNAALLALFEANLDVIVGALSEADFVELGPKALVVHRRRSGGPAS